MMKKILLYIFALVTVLCATAQKPAKPDYALLKKQYVQEADSYKLQHLAAIAAQKISLDTFSNKNSADYKNALEKIRKDNKAGMREFATMKGAIREKMKSQKLQYINELKAYVSVQPYYEYYKKAQRYKNIGLGFNIVGGAAIVGGFAGLLEIFQTEYSTPTNRGLLFFTMMTGVSLNIASIHFYKKRKREMTKYRYFLENDK